MNKFCKIIFNTLVVFVVYMYIQNTGVVEAAANISLRNLRNNFSTNYFNNFKVFMEDNGININVVTLKTIVNGIHIHVNVQSKVPNSKTFRNLFTYDLDVCPMLATMKRSLLKNFFDTIRRYGNFKPQCPIESGNYYVKNWKLDPKKIPGTFYGGQYVIYTYGYYGKYHTKSEIYLFDGSGEIYIS